MWRLTEFRKIKMRAVNHCPGSIRRATSLPHFLQVPRRIRQRPSMTPFLSCMEPPVPQCGHQMLSRISFLVFSGICCQRCFAATVKSGNASVSTFFMKCFSKSAWDLRKLSSVMPTDLAFPIGFDMNPLSWSLFNVSQSKPFHALAPQPSSRPWETR